MAASSKNTRQGCAAFTGGGAAWGQSVQNSTKKNGARATKAGMKSTRSYAIGRLEATEGR